MDFNQNNQENENSEANVNYGYNDANFYTQPATVTSPIIEKKNRGMGVLGAALGALLGGVLWTLVSCAGYISGWISVLIFLLAQGGYSKFSGAKKGEAADTFGVVISVIFGLLIIIPANYVAYGYGVYKALDKVFPFTEVLRDLLMYMDRYELWGDFFMNLGLSYLFTGFVAVMVLVGSRSGKRKNKQNLK